MARCWVLARGSAEVRGARPVALGCCMAAALSAACSLEREQEPPPPTLGAVVALSSITLDPAGSAPGSGRIALSWEVEGDLANFAVLLRKTAGASDEEVASGIDARAFTIERGPSWQLDWPTATVKVRACPASGPCVESNEQPLLPALEAGVAALSARAGASGLFDNAMQVSENGDTLAVGVQGEPVAQSAARAGTAYVFERNAARVWQEAQRWQGAYADYGQFLALSASGATLAVSSPSVLVYPGECGGPNVVDHRINAEIYRRDALRAWSSWQTVLLGTPERNMPPELVAPRVMMNAAGDSIYGDTGRHTILFKVLYDRFYLENLVPPDDGGPVSHDEGNDVIDIDLSAAAAVSANGERIASLAKFARLPPPYTQATARWNAVVVYRYAGHWSPGQPSFALEAVLTSNQKRTTELTTDDFFGSSPVFDREGRTLAVGAYEDWSDTTGVSSDPHASAAPRSGAIYVFGRNDDGTWQQQAFLKQREPKPDDFFGRIVRISDDGRVVAGSAFGHSANATGVARHHAAGTAPGAPMNGSPNARAVYVFTRLDDAGWAHRAAVVPPAPSTSWGLSSFALSADASTLALGVSDFSEGPTTPRIFVY